MARAENDVKLCKDSTPFHASPTVTAATRNANRLRPVVPFEDSRVDPARRQERRLLCREAAMPKAMVGVALVLGLVINLVAIWSVRAQTPLPVPSVVPVPAQPPAAGQPPTAGQPPQATE